jgi:deoxyribodipyrimidine photo-lyase
MRSLKATGWINFRMRAMMQSVAAYTLWLPWQKTGNHLARLFIDYEPGIHWSQIHMQSGVTGINAVRAYSIIKQSLDHDPSGDFIRTWVPELSMVPTPYIHEPWTMSESMQKTTGTVIGAHYPPPIVDENEARSLGIKAAYAARKHDEVKARSARVYTQHGSRKQRRQRRSPRAPPAKEVEKDPQTSLLDFQAVQMGSSEDKGRLKG